MRSDAQQGEFFSLTNFGSGLKHKGCLDKLEFRLDPVITLDVL
jgi:hypothetical protein